MAGHGTCGTTSGYVVVCSDPGYRRPATSMPASAATPDVTTIHSVACHESGRYFVRIGWRPPNSTAPHAIAVPSTSSGSPITVGDVASSSS